MILDRLCGHESPGSRLRQTFCVDQHFAASVAMFGPWPQRVSCGVLNNMWLECVVAYAHYACVAECADAMADAWEDTAGCAQAICLHENLLN